MAEEPKKQVKPQLPPEEGFDYKPGFLANTVGAFFGESAQNKVRPVNYGTTSTHQQLRLQTVKVWSDIQGKQVPAFEYLRETEPVEDTIVRDTVDAASEVGGKKLKRRFKWLDPEKMVREKAIGATTGLIPMAGKAIGKAGKTITGLDVTMMGDATIDGASRRANEAARAEYDRLAVHFKRNEVMSAVRGDNYQPNFLQGIEHVRKVTDGFQDFELKGQYGEGFIDRRAMDQSEAGDAYRNALWMGTQTDPNKAYKSAKSASLGKVTMNYDRKNSLPVA
jgi:hypothetical protein